ncbi:hypothetical protein NliqN6_5080 [Naganishia liquefaciens]|uniref:Uncharacterized protein n=1 Tax=Naganishia liquefaciens TaxID=104408 RepID=A0A8H3TX30_9TREE|nr:hypothetical protein NliqN6_5080 [Naganishia liquefaciens]
MGYIDEKQEKSSLSSEEIDDNSKQQEPSSSSRHPERYTARQPYDCTFNQQPPPYTPREQDGHRLPQPQPQNAYAAQPQPQQRSAAPQEALTGSIYQQALQRYGNPLAHNAEWSPTQQDYNALVLPTIDLTMRLKARFAGRGPDQVFDKPPVSFSRPRNPGAFQPRPFAPWSCRSVGKGKIAGEGFKGTYAGDIMVPHDVSAADWFRFLEDIVVSAKLTGAQQVLSNAAPIAMKMGVTGYFVTKAIQNGMMKKKNPAVIETIEVWNQRFFTARGLDVMLIKGKERLTGLTPGGPIPQSGSTIAAVEAATAVQREGSSTDSSSDSSSSSSESGDDAEEVGTNDSSDRRQAKAKRKQERRERKDKRRKAKRERKDTRKEEKRERKAKRREDKEAKFLLTVASLLPYESSIPPTQSG